MNHIQFNDAVLDLRAMTAYDAFGNVVSQVIEQRTSSDLDADAYHIDGLDTDDNLHFNEARFYDPSQGRWLNLEPLGFEAGQDNMFPSSLLLIRRQQRQ